MENMTRGMRKRKNMRWKKEERGKITGNGSETKKAKKEDKA
jgi:hypothetical protein